MTCLRLCAVLAVTVATSGLVAAEYKVQAVKKLPDGLSKPVAATLDANGIQIVGESGPVCELWLVKKIAVEAGFSPTLNVHYPLAPGQLVGALRIAKGVEFTDFRGQEFSAGVYTLRYGRQPEDGNHIGTSELYDFLLALPAKIDTAPTTISGFEALSGKSAQAVGSTHPAILSLLPQKEVKKSGVITHDEDHDFWLLDLIGAGTAKGQASKVPMRIVIVGRALE